MLVRQVNPLLVGGMREVDRIDRILSRGVLGHHRPESIGHGAPPGSGGWRRILDKGGDDVGQDDFELGLRVYRSAVFDHVPVFYLIG